MNSGSMKVAGDNRKRVVKIGAEFWRDCRQAVVIGGMGLPIVFSFIITVATAVAVSEVIFTGIIG